MRTHLCRCAAGSDPGAEGLEDGRLYSGVDGSFLWKLINVIDILSVSAGLDCCDNKLSIYRTKITSVFYVLTICS